MLLLAMRPAGALHNTKRKSVSKWEQGVSVSDSDMLILLSEALQTPVSTLLVRIAPIIFIAGVGAGVYNGRVDR